MKKKKITQILREIKYFIFNSIYGRVKYVKKAKDLKQIYIKKIIFNKTYKYNFYKIPNGKLYTDTTHDVAYLVKNCLINEPSFQYRYKKENLKIYNSPIKENIVIKKGFSTNRKVFNENIFSLLSGGAGKNNYWHWLFDVLPRIAILEKSNCNMKPQYYLLPSLSKKFQLDSLISLNIPQKYLLDGEKMRHFSCDNLMCVDHPVVLNNNPSKSINNIPLWIIYWLRKKYLKRKTKKINYPKKIFINREEDSNLKSRKIINTNQVKNILEKNGYKSVTLSKLNINEQIMLFNNVKIIIGLHGAGFANIIFSKKGTKVIEIKTKNNGDAILHLARKCKLNYKKIVEKNASKILPFQGGDLSVDLIKLEKLITRLK